MRDGRGENRDGPSRCGLHVVTGWRCIHHVGNIGCKPSGVTRSVRFGGDALGCALGLSPVRSASEHGVQFWPRSMHDRHGRNVLGARYGTAGQGHRTRSPRDSSDKRCHRIKASGESAEDTRQ